MTKRNESKLQDVPQYLAGIQHSGDEPIISDLSLNESRLGPSEFAVSAFSDARSTLWRYPDGSHSRLKEAVAGRFKVDPNRIVCGAGADELITLLTRLLAGAGDEIVFPEFSFIMFSLNALRIGALPVEAKTAGFAPLVDSLLACITDRTRAVFVASPNNPTGTYLARNDVRRLVSEIPSHIPLILDGAYSEYMGCHDYSDGLELIDEFPNLIVLRSFSKIFGLASLRIGWCCASRSIVDGLERLRGPYNISGPAQAAAVAALEDEAHIKMVRDHNRRWHDRIASVFTRIGLRFVPSGGNFIMTIFPDPETANRAYHYLRARGVLTRQLRDYMLPHCLRITIGTNSDNELLLQSLEEFVSLERHIDPAQSLRLNYA
ncbi:MAG TPA: histidinol-phosphate transaminase [Pyrinomonadaceae bacterium]|jgi:histidinol-phosphate aminotransferase